MYLFLLVFHVIFFFLIINCKLVKLPVVSLTLESVKATRAGMGEAGTPQPTGMVLDVGTAPTAGPGAARCWEPHTGMAAFHPQPLVFLTAAKNCPGKNGNQLLRAHKLCVQELCQGGQSQHGVR